MHNVPLSAGALVFLSALQVVPLAQAQIIPDNTLPTSSAIPSGCLTCLIEGGTSQGNNIFHSFLEFSVPTGGQAIFNNGPDVFNIFSRVTGTSISSIDGLLGANGIANLYFINPNGILFGPNARLDIGGSFLASTATALTFPDGSEFSSVAPQATPLIGWNVPVGLQYGPGPGGNIASTGQLSAGQDLVLAAGGDLRLEGQLLSGRNMVLSAGDTLAVRDLNQPFIAAAGGTLIVEGLQDVDIFALNFRDSGFFSGDDMTLRSSEVVGGDARYWAGGNFRVENFDGQLASLYSPYDPVIRAIGNVEFVNYVGGSLHILAGGSVTITGYVTINAVANPGEGLREENPIPLWTISPILLREFIRKNPVDIEIDGEARRTLDIRAGVSFIAADERIPDPLPLHPFLVPRDPPDFPGFNSTQPILTALPRGSDITIEGTVTVKNGDIPTLILLTNLYESDPAMVGDISVAWLTTQSDNEVPSGDIFVTSSGSINLLRANQDQIGISANTDGVGQVADPSKSGNAGNIWIVAGDSIDVTAGNVNVGAARGNGGNMFLYAVNDITTSDLFAGLVINNPDDQSEFGRGGNISIFSIDGNVDTRAGRVETQGPSTGVFANTSGDISITTLNGDIAVGEVDGRSQFASGRVSFDSPNGTLIFDGREIGVSTTKAGEGTDIVINAANLVLRNGARLFANAAGSAQGANIVINAGSVLITDGSSISVLSEETASAGSITVNANSMQMEGGSRVLASSTFGEGGNININLLDSLVLRFDSDIRAEALADGGGGNINLNVGRFILGILSEDSDVIASSASGRGGVVTANAALIAGFRLFSGVETPESDFFEGINGEITINVDENAFPELPSDFLDASNWFSAACPAGGTPTTQAPRSVAENRFTVLGRSGLPSTPESPFADESGNVNPMVSIFPLEQPGNRDVLSSDVDPSPVQIVEANSWRVDEQGRTVLQASTQTQGNIESAGSQQRCR